MDAVTGAVGLRRRHALRNVKEAAAAISRAEPGVVMAHNSAPVLSLVDGKHQRVLYAHNDILRSYQRREARQLASSLDLIVGVSEFLAEQIRGRLSVGDRRRVVSVLNGVDTRLFRPPNFLAEHARPRILFLGRMVRQKGPDVLIQACCELDPSLDFELVLVGSNGFAANEPLTAYEQRLRNLAAPLGDRVIFLPFQPRSEVPDLLRSADVMVVPSQWADPCPLTVLEGLATGLPMVATAVGGCPEVVGDAGWVVPSGSVNALADVLAQLIADPAQRRVAATRARARATQLTWAHTEQALESVLGAVDTH